MGLLRLRLMRDTLMSFGVQGATLLHIEGQLLETVYATSLRRASLVLNETPHSDGIQSTTRALVHVLANVVCSAP